jgi:hypothetical protein
VAVRVLVIFPGAVTPLVLICPVAVRVPATFPGAVALSSPVSHRVVVAASVPVVLVPVAASVPAACRPVV